MTADELWMLPDDGMRHELLAGRLTVMEPTGFEHGRVACDVLVLLREHVGNLDLGVASAAETGFVIGRDPDTVRAPDAAFVTKERYDAIGRTERFWPEAPAFAAEVLSPGDTTAEVQAKAFAWLDAGTRAVLVLDPAERTAIVYRRRDDVRSYERTDVVDLADAVPGWRLSLPELFG
jgi:Uma2 family endonuclease